MEYGQILSIDTNPQQAVGDPTNDRVEKAQNQHLRSVERLVMNIKFVIVFFLGVALVTGVLAYNYWSKPCFHQEWAGKVLHYTEWSECDEWLSEFESLEENTNLEQFGKARRAKFEELKFKTVAYSAAFISSLLLAGILSFRKQGPKLAHEGNIDNFSQQHQIVTSANEAQRSELPLIVTCTKCQSRLELEPEERKSGKFECPNCGAVNFQDKAE